MADSPDIPITTTPTPTPASTKLLRPVVVASSASAAIARPSRPPGSTSTAPLAQPPSKPPPTTSASQSPTSQSPTLPRSASSQSPTTQPPPSSSSSSSSSTAPISITTTPHSETEVYPPSNAQQATTQPNGSHHQRHSGPPTSEPNGSDHHHHHHQHHSGPSTEQSHSESRTESENEEEGEGESEYSELEQNVDSSEIEYEMDEINQDEPDVQALPADLAFEVKKVWAVVKFNYDTTDAEELALQPDEVIEIVEQNDDGWWKGKNVFGKEGIFPHNFVVLTDDPTIFTSVRASPIMQSSPAAFPDYMPTSATSSPALSLKSARRSIFQKKKSKEDDLHGSSPIPFSHSPILSSSSNLPGIRKNSGDKKKDRKSQTLQGGPSTPTQSSKTSASKIVTSPSMPSLASLTNKTSRSPSESNMQYYLHAAPQGSDSNVTPRGPQPSSSYSGLQSSTSGGAFSAVTSTPTTPTSPGGSTPYISPFSSSTNLLPAYTPTPASPTSTSSPSSLPSSPDPSPRSGTSATLVSPGDSFIMKVHIPPSGSSQFKVSPNQTVGDLIAMVAKKRVYNVKDCSMRLPTALHYNPAIDPSTPISHIGTKELRLFLEGESAASLPPISSQAIHTPNPTPIPALYNQSLPPSVTNPNGRSIKEGYMNKADSNKKMKKVWVTLDKNFVYFYKTALDKNPTERISLYCATPKLSSDPKKKHYFDLLTVTNTYSFSADNDAEANSWVSALQDACQALIMKQIGGDPNNPPAVKAAERKDPQHTKELVLKIRDLSENNTCAECGAANPEWAAINLGIFFCIDCSSIHRSMGVHISQVRSVVLDHWDLSQIMIMENMGNKRANEFWEHTVPPQFTKPNPKSTIEEREEWIRAKYQQKQFIESAASVHTNDRQRNNTTLTSILHHLKPESSSNHSSPRSVTPTPPTSINSDESKPASTPATNAPTTSPENPASASSQPQQLQGPQRIPGLDFVGYGFFANLDDPSRPSLRRQMRLFKNSFDENRNVHVAINNAPVNTWRDVEYLVVDHYSVDTSSVRGYVPAATKVFEKNEDYLKFLSTHTHPQLDNYRQTLSLQSESASSATDTPKWYVVTELRMELYELFVDQIDDEGLSPHVTKAVPVLTEGDPALLAQFIKKNGTHFIRSAVYGGRTLLKTLVDKTLVPDKDEAGRLCQQNFKSLFEGETPPSSSAEDLKKVQNYAMDITGGDNRKRGLEWVQSIWDRPQVLSYDMEMISQVFDDLSLSVKIEAAANEYIEKTKG